MSTFEAGAKESSGETARGIKVWGSPEGPASPAVGGCLRRDPLALPQHDSRLPPPLSSSLALPLLSASTIVTNVYNMLSETSTSTWSF